MREIGICWDGCGELADEKQISLMKENGFSATFLGSNADDLLSHVRRIREAGIRIDNYHAPFAKENGIGINAIWATDETGDVMLKRLTDGVIACVKTNVPALVVHLSSGDNNPRINDIGHERFSRLVDLADREGITLCFENQRKLSNLAYIFETFPSARFCWDVGHEACFADGRQFMPLFGDKLQALHIHDNDGIHEHDLHMLPGDGSIDFDRVAKQIADSGYPGTVMLEFIYCQSGAVIHEDGPYLAMSPEERFRRAGIAARTLADKIDRLCH